MPTDAISRAYSITGFHVFQKLPDGRILFTAVNQNDFNLSGAMGKIATAVAVG